jgi:HrpA-like RNA helicase
LIFLRLRQAAIRTVVQIHLYEPKGDILLFLTGQEVLLRFALYLHTGRDSVLDMLRASPIRCFLPKVCFLQEIDEACRKIEGEITSAGTAGAVKIIPLYSSLPPA